MIRIKDGVTPRNLVIAAAAANVASVLGVDVTITSGTDGKHMDGSKHYTGEALDIRLLGVQTPHFMDALAARLGAAYQLVLEANHLHVEYDPKEKP